jgi:hypothetical protein
MPHFLTDVTMTQFSGLENSWRRWTLVHPLVYERSEGHQIVCPEGFITDGPSIPRFLWAFLPVWGSWGRAGIVHDYICMLIANGTPHLEAKNRTEADGIFYEAMVALGTGFFTRWAMYAGVRLGALMGVPTDSILYNADLLGGA